MNTRRRDSGQHAHKAALRARREQFLALRDLSVGHGLEIGPLDSAVTDPATDDVSYVDVFDREGMVSQYSADENVILELIPEIHYPLDDGGVIRSLDEAAAAGAPYDWVVASHVIEHVPDVIGWFGQLARLTVDEGALVLAVPDRRYCFDRHRPPTTTGQMIAAHEAGDRRPGVRAVYDFFSTAVTVDTQRLREGGPPPTRAARMYDAAAVEDALKRCRAGEYVDCHVWTFTPESLLDQVRELRGLGLCDWRVEKLVPVPDGLEFFAVLRRLPRDSAPDAADSLEPPLRADMPDWLLDEWTDQETVRRQRARIRSLRRRNRRLRRRLITLEGSWPRRLRSALVRRVRGRANDKA